MRMPETDQEREKLIAKLHRDLKRFQAVPAHRREAEHADEREETCRALLRDLGVRFDPL
jgi:hypothetical protein